MKSFIGRAYTPGATFTSTLLHVPTSLRRYILYEFWRECALLYPPNCAAEIVVKPSGASASLEQRFSIMCSHGNK